MRFELPDHKRSDDSDPFRGAQHDVAIRVTGILWILGPVTLAPFTPLYPPTAQVGALGWLAFASLALGSIGFGVLALTLRIRPSWNRLYLSSLNAVAMFAALQWLAGGGDAPYLQWLLLPLLGSATQRSAWRCLPVVMAAAAAAFSPLLYSNLDVPSTVAQLTVMSVMTFVVASVMASVRDHRARLRDAKEHAATLARLDMLTGLPNRRSFEEALEQAVGDHHARGCPLSLLLCDVNSFKEINDAFGHPAGDECLRSIGATLRDGLREPDAAFRWAGDEFSVLLPDTDDASATEAAARVADAVHARCSRPDGKPITIGVGLATLGPTMNAGQFLAEADVALLESKAARRRFDVSADAEASSDAARVS